MPSSVILFKFKSFSSVCVRHPKPKLEVVSGAECGSDSIPESKTESDSDSYSKSAVTDSGSGSDVQMDLRDLLCIAP